MSAKLAINIKNRDVMYAAYMPFIEEGGLFIPTNTAYQLGDRLQFVLILTELDEQFDLEGKVVWLSPKNGSNGQVAGVGVQFLGDLGKKVHAKVEQYLGDAMQLNRPTYTL